jgi:hypothetical protein
VRSWLIIGVLFAAQGCDSCADRGAEVGGAHPYVRCAAIDEPEAREGTVGSSGAGAGDSLRYRVEGRMLHLDRHEADADEPLVIAAFRGPGGPDAATRGALLGLEEQSVDLVFVLGGLGRTPEAVTELLRALTIVRVPVVVLPGGDDDARAVAAGWEALSSDERAPLFDGRRLRGVRVGADEIALASGAPDGRYAADDGACGLAADDVEALVDVFDEPDEGVRRWLVSWAAPRGSAISRGFGGAEAGDARIAELARALHAGGGLFAFPETHALEPMAAGRPLEPGAPSLEARVVVAPLAGPPVERADGSLVPSAAAVFTLGPRGLAYRGTAVSGATVAGAEGRPNSPAERALTAPGPPL